MDLPSFWSLKRVYFYALYFYVGLLNFLARIPYVSTLAVYLPHPEIDAIEPPSVHQDALGVRETDSLDDPFEAREKSRI
ncbi:hypothetical protein EV182_002409, partial [Spiromyces aspiralis]